MIFIIALIVLDCYSYSLQLNNDENQLIQLIIIARHGARTPSSKIPSLPCDDLSNTSHELTSLGINEQFILGKSLRSQYHTFIPQNYSRNEFLFFSSSEDRTLMSAQANLQGLFEDQFKKQPYPVFPIHSWSQETDYLLKAGSLCQDPIDKILSKIYEQDEYKEKEKDNQDLLNKLQQTGDFKQPIFLTNISKVADPLLCAIHHNYSQCLFNDTQLVKETIDLSRWVSRYEHPLKNKDLAKLLISPFINDVVDGHDGNIQGLFQLFSQTLPEWVPYSSYVAFEVYTQPVDGQISASEDDIQIKIKYFPFSDKEYSNGKQIDEQEFTSLTENVCSNKSFCSTREIERLVYPTEQWLSLCGIQLQYKNHAVALIILSITLTLLLFVTLGLSAYTCRLQKKNKIYNPISFVGDLNSDSFWV